MKLAGVDTTVFKPHSTRRGGGGVNIQSQDVRHAYTGYIEDGGLDQRVHIC